MRGVAERALRVSTEALCHTGSIEPAVLFFHGDHLETYGLPAWIMDDRVEKYRLSVVLRLKIHMEHIEGLLLVTDTIATELETGQAREALLVTLETPDWQESWRQWYHRDANEAICLEEKETDSGWASIDGLFHNLFGRREETERVQ